MKNNAIKYEIDRTFGTKYFVKRQLVKFLNL